ncbi:LemA family protein [Inconstantimicrobium mannanitabidum]|uniref:Uncharacterized protein n=1 Tax=Inconstantimicrobium mannanitabidum TaxID=1604901 RepID=A0ACB5R7T5_9CLOT|nr:LemA family protein [Clostridium sp. TW13]GKX65232.1 hypothetical protein rsdtw13_04900 [Clostridium sp. TW13]
MRTSRRLLAGIVLVIFLLGVVIVNKYNSLVRLEENVNTASSNIDTKLQRRNDLIPNVVNTVKGYAKQEKGVIDSVTNARTKLAGASTTEDKVKADSELSSAISKLLVVVENYPDLKSSQNFRDLTVELEGAENRIAIARKDYNAAANDYNVKRRTFPTNIVANIFGFKEKALYKASEGAQNVPSVDFSK